MTAQPHAYEVKFMQVTSRLKDIMNSAGQPMMLTGVAKLSKDPARHDLTDFMIARTQEMQQEYTRIQKRVNEDPGTAGDQGEENWASLLRSWLPPTFQIVTKGRILSHEGIASPQVDVLVLHPTYPSHLIDKKLYLAGGVVAAFECKITLRPKHIQEAMSNSVAIKQHAISMRGSPYRDLNSSIIFGLLAHSHDGKTSASDPLPKLYEILYEEDLKQVQHPRQTLDLICVADLGLWNAVRSIQTRHIIGSDFEKSAISKMFEKDGVCTTGFYLHSENQSNQVPGFTPIGAMLTELMIKIAWQNSDVRRIADYFRLANVSGSGQGIMRCWPLTVLSDDVRDDVVAGNKLKRALPMEWDEWSSSF